MLLIHQDDLFNSQGQYQLYIRRKTFISSFLCLFVSIKGIKECLWFKTHGIKLKKKQQAVTMEGFEKWSATAISAPTSKVFEVAAATTMQPQLWPHQLHLSTISIIQCNIKDCNKNTNCNLKPCIFCHRKQN